MRDGLFARHSLQKNGEELEVKVTRITGGEVEYKKWSNQDGPGYVLPKQEVFMIKYKNGDKDVFADSTAPAVTQSAPQQVNNEPQKAEPTADNAALIESYNAIGHKFIGITPKNKKAKMWCGTLGISSSSVLACDEMQIGLVQEPVSYSYTPADYSGKIIDGMYRTSVFWGKYEVEVTNNTVQTIYIDKANSFCINPDGSYRMYYNPQQTTVNQGGNAGGSLNMGALAGAAGVGGAVGTLANGVNMGGGKEYSASTTYADQRVLVIPPHGKAVLSKDEAILIKGPTFGCDKFKMSSFAEDFLYEHMNDLRYGEYKTYSEDSSPLKKSYMLTYSLDPEFATYKQLKFKTYVKDVIGTPNIVGAPGYKESGYGTFLKKFIQGATPKTVIVFGYSVDD